MQHIKTVTTDNRYLKQISSTFERKAFEAVVDRCLTHYYNTELTNMQKWAIHEGTADRRTLNALIRRGIARKIYKPHHPRFPSDLKVVLTKRGEQMMKAVLGN